MAEKRSKKGVFQVFLPPFFTPSHGCFFDRISIKERGQEGSRISRRPAMLGESGPARRVLPAWMSGSAICTRDSALTEWLWQVISGLATNQALPLPGPCGIFRDGSG